MTFDSPPPLVHIIWTNVKDEPIDTNTKTKKNKQGGIEKKERQNKKTGTRIIWCIRMSAGVFGWHVADKSRLASFMLFRFVSLTFRTSKHITDSCLLSLPCLSCLIETKRTTSLYLWKTCVCLYIESVAIRLDSLYNVCAYSVMTQRSAIMYASFCLLHRRSFIFLSCFFLMFECCERSSLMRVVNHLELVYLSS